MGQSLQPPRRADDAPTIFTEPYDPLRELGATDEKARAAAVIHNDSRQLQSLIQAHLTPLEKDLKRVRVARGGFVPMLVSPSSCPFAQFDQRRPHDEE
jgi:hypothetical protein